jgi:hypothetical protein
MGPSSAVIQNRDSPYAGLASRGIRANGSGPVKGCFHWQPLDVSVLRKN